MKELTHCSGESKQPIIPRMVIIGSKFMKFQNFGMANILSAPILPRAVLSSTNAMPGHGSGQVVAVYPRAKHGDQFRCRHSMDVELTQQELGIVGVTIRCNNSCFLKPLALVLRFIIRIVLAHLRITLAQCIGRSKLLHFPGNATMKADVSIHTQMELA